MRKLRLPRIRYDAGDLQLFGASENYIRSNPKVLRKWQRLARPWFLVLGVLGGWEIRTTIMNSGLLATMVGSAWLGAYWQLPGYGLFLFTYSAYGTGRARRFSFIRLHILLTLRVDSTQRIKLLAAPAKSFFQYFSRSFQHPRSIGRYLKSVKIANRLQAVFDRISQSLLGAAICGFVIFLITKNPIPLVVFLYSIVLGLLVIPLDVIAFLLGESVREGIPAVWHTEDIRTANRQEGPTTENPDIEDRRHR